MKKALLASAIIVSVGAAASPWIMGSVAEQQFSQAYEALKAQENQIVTLSESSFERGYTTSKAKFTLNYSFPDNEIPPFALVFESSVQHTPIATNKSGTYFFEITSEDSVYLENISKEAQATIDQYLGGKLFTGYSHVNLFGTGATALSSQAIDYKDEVAGVYAQVAPVTLSIEGNFLEEFGTLQLSIENSNFESPEAKFSIYGTTLDASFNKHESGLTVGSSAFNINEINALTPTGPLKLTNANISSNVDVVDNKFNNHATFSIESIESMLPVHAVRYEIDFNGVSQEAMTLLEELNDKAEAFETAALETDPIFGELINATLQPGLELNQEVKISAFDGKLFADLDVLFTGIEGVELEALANPELAPKAIKANFVARADNEAIFKTPAAPMIAEYVQQGLIKQTDTEVSTEIKLVDGVLTINEQEIPLEQVMQLVLMSMAAEEQNIQ